MTITDPSKPKPGSAEAKKMPDEQRKTIAIRFPPAPLTELIL